MKLPVFARAAGIFIGMVGIALALNHLAPFVTEDTFNMYYIGPRFPCTLPVLSAVYDQVPYIVFLLIYIIGFSLVAALLFTCFTAAQKLSAARKG